MNITSFSSNDNYVITFSSNKTSNSYDVLNGDGSSGRSSYCSRRRAFNRASAIIYCNQEKLNTFLTLTYKNQHSDYNKIINDLKNKFSRNKISYIAVVERHKSGNFHIHAICSELPSIISLRKGKYSWSLWNLGFSDVKFISQTDEKFRIEKYMFKYMMKSEKIGGRYFLKSRDLTVYKNKFLFGSLPKPLIQDWDIDFSEYNIYTKDTYSLSVERRYYNGRQNQLIKRLH